MVMMQMRAEERGNVASIRERNLDAALIHFGSYVFLSIQIPTTPIVVYTNLG